MTDNTESFKLSDWAAVKPEAFEIPQEHLDEIRRLAQELMTACDKYQIPANLNYVYKQDSEGLSATEGFTSHGGAMSRTTVEIIMGSYISTLSGAGLANIMPEIAYWANAKSNFISGGGSVIQLPDRI